MRSRKKLVIRFCLRNLKKLRIDSIRQVEGIETEIWGPQTFEEKQFEQILKIICHFRWNNSWHEELLLDKGDQDNVYKKIHDAESYLTYYEYVNHPAVDALNIMQ